MILVGLYGDSRSGKDTVARQFEADYEFEWRSFANALRQILLDINPTFDGMAYLNELVRDYGWDGVKKHWPESVDMMIALGQSVRDNIHEDAWTWSVLSEPLPERLVISDVRQPNEYEKIKALGGEVWKIVRPGTTRRGMDGLLDHRFFDVVIYNNAGPDALRATVDREVSRALQDRWL